MLVYYDLFLRTLKLWHCVAFAGLNSNVRLLLKKTTQLCSTSLVAQMVNRLPTMWETWVQSLVWEDSLEKEMATHSNTLVWKISWTEERGSLQSMGSQRVGHN